MAPVLALAVVVTLVPHGGRTAFRMGEPVKVELVFRADVPGKYQVVTGPDRRYVRGADLDRFTAEPREGARDPLADIPAQIGHARMHVPVPLDGPVTVVAEVNEWVSFGKPGRYRIVAETTRVRGLALRSNALEIEIVAPEEGWAARRAAEAVAVLERGEGDPEAARQAARALRFLETPEAARAMARFFENGPMGAQEELRVGLFGSPHRKEAIAAMERRVGAPEAPVSYYLIGTLMELASAETVPPDPAYPAGDPEALKRWHEEHKRRWEATRPIERHYMAMLGEAVGRKRGRAKAVSLATLFTNGPQPPAPEVTKALLESFPALPEGLQGMLLASEWHRVAAPGIEPFLRRVASGAGAARDAALRRLFETDPAAARAAALARIRAGDVGDDPRVLLLLEDETLPEMDGVLVEALEQGKRVEALVARYASPVILPRVRAWSAARPGMCGAVFAYFFRVDPEWAASEVARRRRDNPGACMLYFSPNEDLLMSPGLERAAIDDLRHPEPMIRRSAMSLLEQGGSAAAEQPLWEALARLKDEPARPLDAGLEYGVTNALLKGAGWVLTPERIERLRAGCVTEQCRSTIDRERRALVPPIGIALLPEEPGGAMIGPFRLRGERQIRAKLAQFPRGTEFRFEPGYGGSWWAGERRKALRALLDAASMR